MKIQGQDVLIQKKTSNRARKLSLRLIVDAFVLTVPARASESSIQRFLTQCIPWIEKQLPNLQTIEPWRPDQEVTLQGQSFQCRLDPLRRKPALCEISKILHLPPRCTKEALHTLLKKQASVALTPLVEKIAHALGLDIARLSFRDQRSRWGSCSAAKNISLNWRLILAPPEVAYYVCVHEVAHILHMNHSPAFWKVVESVCPGYKIHRKWLREHGPSIMRMI